MLKESTANIKHFLRRENKKNKKCIVILRDIKIYSNAYAWRELKTLHFHYIKLTNQLSFEIDLKNMDQHTGGKWLGHGIKHSKDNKFQSLPPPVEYPSWKYKYDIKESDGYIWLCVKREQTINLITLLQSRN